MVVAIVFGIGAVVGAVAHRLFNTASKNTAKLQQRLEQVEDELKAYKASVNSHFSKTSDLVSELTQDYVKVYKHLVEGAQKLGDPSTFSNALEQQQGKVLISFADEVIPEAEASSIQSGSEHSDLTEEATKEQSDEAMTPESQAHLSESMKEVAEKMKGAEEVDQTALAGDEHRSEPQLESRPASEIAAETEAAPGQQDRKQ